MRFDLIVIGSGPGGYKAALIAAYSGASVALIEKAKPGGTCLNCGCIPKKTLLHLASLLEDINNLQGHGLIGQVTSDFRMAIAHKDNVIAGMRENFPIWLKRLGVRTFNGHARCLEKSMNGDYDVEVCTDTSRQVLRGNRIIIATGSLPREHPACPTDGERIIHSGHFMTSLSDRPESILVIGGGAVGCELAFLLRQFGSRVTIVESTGRLLNKPSLPERASQALERKFHRLGIEVRKNLLLAHCQSMPSGAQVTFSDGGVAIYEKVLIAIGRQASSTELGLQELGVRVDAQGFIETNEYLETNLPGIYAVGDVKNGPMTANAALHDAKVASANALKGNHASPNYDQVPIVIDSALEIAAVGLTEERAEAAGFSPDVARSSFGNSVKARARNDYEGFIEVVHDGETGQLLGGCIVGPEAGEQIHMMAAGYHSQRGLWFFTDMNYSHPSWTEELENAIRPYAFALAKTGKNLFRTGLYSATQEL